MVVLVVLVVAVDIVAQGAQELLAKVITVGLVRLFGLITKRITSNAVMHIGKLVVVVVQADHLQRLLPQHTLVKVAITTHGANQL
jgi:hypothetical protein